MKLVRQFTLLISMAAAASAASGQCYEFSGSGADLQITVGAIAFQIGPIDGVTNYNFTGSAVFSPGGAAQTSTISLPVGSVNIQYVNFGASSLTSFQMVVPNADTNTTVGDHFWTVVLGGVGNLIPGSLLPAPSALPPISAWTGVGNTNMISVTHGGAPATYAVTFAGACGQGPGTGGTGSGSTATSPTQALGDPTSVPGDCGCGDPINVGTGNVYEEIADYRTAGTNRLGFTRYYNSMASANTFAAWLGTNWRSNYDRYLRLSSSTSVIAERANGQQVTFTLASGIWTTDTDIDVALTNSGSMWTLTDHDDTVDTYATSGASEAVLQTIKARNGYTQTLAYNSSGQVTTVTDSFNRQLTFAYNGALLQSVTTPDGLVLTFGFSSGMLTSVGYSTTPATSQQYLYENSSFPAAITGVIDENGSRYSTWTYDPTGRALTNQHAGGVGLFTVAYNDTDGSRIVTGPVGQPATYHFTTLQNVPKVTELDYSATATTPAAKILYTYDTSGYLASRTDWNGNLTNLINDVHGQPTSIVEAAGTPQQRTTTITYLSNFHLPQQIVAPTVTAGFTYDSGGELLTYTLTDTSSNTTPYATAGQTRTWTFTWSNFLARSVKGPRTDVSDLTKSTYDASGALTSVTNALNQTTQITQHLPGGLPLTAVDRNNVTTTLTYDARQHLLTSTIATSAGSLTTKLTYDAAENVLSASLPDGSGFSNTYDSAHRLIARTDLFGQSLNSTLDAGGDATQSTVKDSGGNVHLTHFAVYDALGRAIQTIGGAGQTVSYAYDPNGNRTKTTDALNHPWQQAFDALNRVVKTTDPANGVTSITYDPASRPASITDRIGATTQFTYDGFGDLIQEVSPSSGTTVYYYDASGNRTQRIDSRGVISNYAYDALNRRISAAYPGNSAENVTLTYDQGSFGIGRLTSVTDAAGTLTRTYDERGNRLTETRTHGSATLTTSYTYDAASHLVFITYPSGWSIGYTRDKMGRITAAAATRSGQTVTRLLVSAITYQPLGPVSALTYGNGITETRTFDGEYRVTQLAASVPSVQNLTYGYDAENNVLSIADGVNSANSQSFGYDAVNRLISASGVYGKLGYGYDSNGNRASETSSATSDGLGSVTALTYNQSGRLASVSSGAQQLAQYTYDAFGHRLAKTGSITGTTLYQYVKGALLEESDAQGNAQVDYVYLKGRPIATIQADGSFHFLHDDRLGTPQAATDSAQSVAWSTTYQPFGLIANPPTQISLDLRLPSQEADIETGLNHNGFRDYSPGTGKYIQGDPVGLLAGTNRYAYAGGNPLAATDSAGLADATQVQQLQTMACQAIQKCSWWDNLTVANNVLAGPVAPPAPAPAEPQLLNPSGTVTSYGASVMMCSSAVRDGAPLSSCDPVAVPAVSNAFAQQGMNQLDQWDQSLATNVVEPSLINFGVNVAGVATDGLTEAFPENEAAAALGEALENVGELAEGYDDEDPTNAIVTSPTEAAGMLTKATQNIVTGIIPCPKAQAAAQQ